MLLHFINWHLLLMICGASLVAQMAKNLSAMWETQVWALSWKDPLDKRIVTHSSILAWRIPWTEEPGGHDWVSNTQTIFFINDVCHSPIWVWWVWDTSCTFFFFFLAFYLILLLFSCKVMSDSFVTHGLRSLVGYSPWGHKESDTTERHHFLSFYTLAK